MPSIAIFIRIKKKVSYKKALANKMQQATQQQGNAKQKVTANSVAKLRKELEELIVKNEESKQSQRDALELASKENLVLKREVEELGDLEKNLEKECEAASLAWQTEQQNEAAKRQELGELLQAQKTLTDAITQSEADIASQRNKIQTTKEQMKQTNDERTSTEKSLARIRDETKILLEKLANAKTNLQNKTQTFEIRKREMAVERQEATNVRNERVAVISKEHAILNREVTQLENKSQQMQATLQEQAKKMDEIFRPFPYDEYKTHLETLASFLRTQLRIDLNREVRKALYEMLLKYNAQKVTRKGDMPADLYIISQYQEEKAVVATVCELISRFKEFDLQKSVPDPSFTSAIHDVFFKTQGTLFDKYNGMNKASINEHLSLAKLKYQVTNAIEQLKPMMLQNNLSVSLEHIMSKPYQDYEDEPSKLREIKGDGILTTDFRVHPVLDLPNTNTNEPTQFDPNTWKNKYAHLRNATMADWIQQTKKNKQVYHHVASSLQT